MNTPTNKMWYFIHIPKCAGIFVQNNLGLECGHSHHNLKLNGLGDTTVDDKTGKIELSPLRFKAQKTNCLYASGVNEDLQGFGRQLYEAHARSGAVPLRLGQRIKGPVINEGPIEINFVDKKGTNIGKVLVAGRSHKPFIDLYVDKINRKNGKCSFGLLKISD